MSDMLPPREAKAIVDFLNRHIPSDASVTAPTNLVPPLAHRKRIYMFPNPFQQVAFGPSVEALKQQIEMRVKPLPVSEFHKRMREQPVDFVVLKARPSSYWPLGFDAYETLVLHTLTCPDYGVIAVQGDVVILKHKADFSQGLRLLGVSTKRQEQLRDKVKAAWERLKSVRW